MFLILLAHMFERKLDLIDNIQIYFKNCLILFKMIALNILMIDIFFFFNCCQFPVLFLRAKDCYYSN